VLSSATRDAAHKLMNFFVRLAWNSLTCWCCSSRGDRQLVPQLWSVDQS